MINFVCLLRTCSARTAPNELKTSPKLHQIMFYKIMKKRNHLIVLRALLLLQSVISISFWPPFIGNPNFQDILNWILQILHYYCRKQHKNIKNSRIIEQNLVLSFFLLSVYCDLCFLSSSSTAEFFHFLNETSQVIICAVYSFVFCFENDFLQV